MVRDFVYPTLEQVLDLHEDAVKLFGGRMPINDFTMLLSALNRPRASFGGQDLYTDIYSKGATLLQSMILNHPFDDGNKRTAFLTTALFFDLNGHELLTDLYSEVTYDFVIGIDLKKYPFEDISSWLKKHSRKRR